MAGYLLIPEMDSQKFFILYGTGGNGKSQLLGLLEALAGGRNTAHVSLRELTENRFAKAELFDKLLNCAKEVSGYIKNTDIIKDVTGGEAVQAEHKFQDTFKFKNFAKLIFSSNDLPTFDAKDEGLHMRMVIIPFLKTFSGRNRDEKILAKMTTPGELSGFLNRALSGLKRLKSNKSFTETEIISQALSNFKIRNDNLAYFLSEQAFITGEDKDYIETGKLYGLYYEFCKATSSNAIAPNKFKDRLLAIDSRIRYKRVKIYGKQPRVFTGIVIDGSEMIEDFNSFS